MNIQPKGRGIEWTQATWNPIAGCKHACRWTMPDGSIARCYAEDVAEGVAQSAYPSGFSHHYSHTHRLNEPLAMKRPLRIFLDSMSDLMGAWVPTEEINAVLDVCRQAHWHTFQLLTKNAPRLTQFDIPPNVWVGVSAPPTHMLGRQLTTDQQHRMLARGLSVLRGIDVPVRWMSIEPLSFDIAPLLANCGLQWAVIGAASNGRKTYQPEAAWVENALTTLDAQGVKTFFKGNLQWPRDAWRDDYPAVQG